MSILWNLAAWGAKTVTDGIQLGIQAKNVVAQNKATVLILTFLALRPYASRKFEQVKGYYDFVKALFQSFKSMTNPNNDATTQNT